MTWLLLIIVGLFSSIMLSRRAGNDAVLVKIVTASYLIRTFLALVLFAISAWQLPILPSLQVGNGFWRFAWDGDGYHHHALLILKAWRAGIDLQSVFHWGKMVPDAIADTTVGYFILSFPIAIVYWTLGTSPLHFALINAWLGSLTAILSYLIVRRLADGQGARIAAALVAFWPSSILWSSQLLKDTIVLMLILAAFCLLIVIWQDASGIARRSGHIREILRWFTLVIVVIALTRFREYVGYILFASVGVAMGIACGIAAFGRKWRQALIALGLTIGVGGATLVAPSIDLLTLFSPSNPEVGHVNLGLECQRKGDLERAVAEFQRAIELNHQYAPAYYSLGVTLVEQGRMKEAIRVYQNYLVETNPEVQRLAQEFLARPGTLEEAAKGTQGKATKEAEVSKSKLGETFASTTKQIARAVDQSVSVFGKFLDQARGVKVFFSLDRINVYRQGMLTTGGHSLVDSAVTFSNLWDVLAYLPRGLAIAFLAPFPQHWSDTGGETGIFRSLSAIEVILVCFLLPAMVSAFWTLLMHHRVEDWLLLAFIALTAVGLGLIAANVGILFRLRLQFLLPLLIVIGIGGLPGPYRRLLDVLRQKFVTRFPLV